MKRAFGRPSPAMVVAIVALIAALAGTAFAGGFITKKKAKKVAANQVNKLAPGLSVAHANTAGTADRPYAYGRINGSGVVTPTSLSQNLPNAGHPSDGIYCFDLPFTPVHGQATGQAQGGGDDIAMIELSGAVDPPPGCPAGTDAEARNYDVSVGNEANDVLYVQFWK
jgi:hypothetical protein